MTKLWRVLLVAAMIVLLTAGSAVAAGLIDRDDQWIRGRWSFFHDVTFESPDCEVTFEDDVDMQGNLDILLGAAENVAIDAATTAQTQTDGVLDLNFASLTTGTEGVNINANITSTAGAVTIAGLEINLDDDSSGGTPIIRGISIASDDVTGSGSIVGINLANTVEIGINSVVGAANQAVVIDAASTDNTGTAGVLDYSYDTLTTGGVFMHIDSAFVAGGASGETIDVVVIDTDDDSDAAGTFTGLSVLCSDSTGSSAMVGIEAYGHDTDLLLGVADTDAGLAILSGATTALTQGGKVSLETAMDHDTTINSFDIQVSSDDLIIGPNTNTDALKYDGGTNLWNATASDFVIGEQDTVRGTLQLSGHVTGSTNGGRIGLYLAADHDTTIDGYYIQASSDDLTIGPDTNSNLITLTAEGDLTLEDNVTGGNAAAKNQISALPKLAFVSLGTMTNGTTETTTYMDDTPSGEWTQVTVTAPPTLTDDTTYYRIGAKSLKMAWGATAVDGDGVTHTIVNDSLEDTRTVGFWFYTDTALTAGWLEFVITDDGGARTFNIPAVSAANINKWQWIEIDITSLTGGTGDVCSAVLILMSAAGEAGLGAFNCYVDGVWKWIATDEEALGQDIKDFGVLGVMTVVDAAAGANRQLALVENTDFFVHYESGNDFIVTITDQSTYAGWAVVAY